MSASETCPKCGAVYLIGEDYRCPHGGINGGGVIDDTLPGGARWMHNLGPTPVWIESKSQFKQELSARGLEQVERKTYNRDDKSPYATRTRLRAGQRDPFLQGAEKR